MLAQNTAARQPSAHDLYDIHSGFSCVRIVCTTDHHTIRHRITDVKTNVLSTLQTNKESHLLSLDYLYPTPPLHGHLNINPLRATPWS